MSYGLTPYDKKRYRDSKRRRRQAAKASKTGRILPFSTARRRLVIAIAVVVIVIGASVGGYFVYNAFADKTETKSAQQLEQEQSEELLRVVNGSNPLSADYVPKLKSYGDFKVNALAENNLENFCNKAKESGIEINLVSAYVYFDEQEKLYSEKLSEFLANPDYTEVRAQAAAQKLVPRGGCSEAQTGLLIGFDMTDEKTVAFIERECINFGFVQRYPKDKEDVTKMSENKMLYRYVGIENSKKMRSFNMSLEEYSEYVSLQKNQE
ncbi:D-alanyl-D-alanine carboxypeptidase family protein [Ruminococcus sp.]|uniref:D-alanyl-D-alanine carboxypeptidase family protein n=1 Tax=Ruminococcus sp. TaxID=41978 RepID=UPI00262AC39E|nr:D-alanyl-D-alanine carboxypeptidase family protein [Ruminococcus sp.]MDD6989704.1 D-alanyl-D-alanine carboxypeptidase family protein [Ruminococcus sp.]MDY6201843.1 D-alanyl-D-alanine carboxypeptidase family protein [Ruminococcus sp.]